MKQMPGDVGRLAGYGRWSQSEQLKSLGDFRMCRLKLAETQGNHEGRDERNVMWDRFCNVQ